MITATIPAAALALAGVSVLPLAVSSAPRDPQEPVTVNAIVVRAASPSSLGDADATTRESASLTPLTANPAGGTIAVTADGLNPCGLPPDTPIDHVVFRALVYKDDTLVGAPSYSNFAMGWHLGADYDTDAVTNDSGDPSFSDDPFKRDDDGIDAGDQVGEEYYVRTGPIATQPNGGAWTPEALDALTDIAVQFNYAAGVQFGGITVCEIFVEVYALEGSKPSVIELRQVIGSVRRIEALAN